MMYPYMILNDDIEVVHSQIIEKSGEKEIEVHFERPTDEGFDTARCSLPSYNWIIKEGFSDSDIDFFERFLHSNAHLLFKYAENGGIKIA
jgi:hypothetical protein